MMIKKIGWKKLLLWGFLTGVLFIILDIVSAVVQLPLLSPYASLPVWKSPPETTLGMLFDIVNGLLLVGVYALIVKSIPGKGLMKGFYYGLIVGVFRTIMGAFSTYVMYAVPAEVVVWGAVLGLLEAAALGAGLVWIGMKIKILD